MTSDKILYSLVTELQVKTIAIHLQFFVVHFKGGLSFLVIKTILKKGKISIEGKGSKK